MLMSLVFGAELGLPASRLIELASFSFFTDVGNLGLRDETLEHAGKLSESEHADVAAARKWSQRFPFVRLSDQPGAVAWAVVVAEQDIDWGHRERPGSLGADANVGLMGSLVAMSRAFETLTTATTSREAMTRDQALELMTTKAAHRFRPELLPLFAKFIKRQSARPLG
jgi:HD-GYP domain-containing protein (c-di-GMP phosphodiesterase class II)